MGNQKHIVITGASRGIGLALAKQFALSGHKVWAISRNIQSIAALEHPSIVPIALDITDEKKILAWASNFETHWDILINNAGMLINKPFIQTTKADFESVYQVNVFGVASIIRALFSFRASSSHIVNISSMGGRTGTSKFPGLAAYSSSKGALSILTELLAEEFKEERVSVNGLALGAVQTEMLSAAFPDFKAPVSADDMASYIMNFSLHGWQFYNGKVLAVSSTTP